MTFLTDITLFEFPKQKRKKRKHERELKKLWILTRLSKFELHQSDGWSKLNVTGWKKNGSSFTKPEIWWGDVAQPAIFYEAT